MSSALVRQALEFVDPDETKVRGKKRFVNTSRPRSIGQALSHPYKQKGKQETKSAVLSKEDLAEENIKKLLALSTPTTNKAVAEKIVQRAILGKPLLEKIEVQATEEKSILFPELNEKQTKRIKSKQQIKK